MAAAILDCPSGGDHCTSVGGSRRRLNRVRQRPGPAVLCRLDLVTRLQDVDVLDYVLSLHDVDVLDYILSLHDVNVIGRFTTLASSDLARQKLASDLVP